MLKIRTLLPLFGLFMALVQLTRAADVPLILAWGPGVSIYKHEAPIGWMMADPGERAFTWTTGIKLTAFVKFTGPSPNVCKKCVITKKGEAEPTDALVFVLNSSTQDALYKDNGALTMTCATEACDAAKTT